MNKRNETAFNEPLLHAWFCAPRLAEKNTKTCKLLAIFIFISVAKRSPFLCQLLSCVINLQSSVCVQIVSHYDLTAISVGTSDPFSFIG